VPLTYMLDEKWCRKILSNQDEISTDDLEWIRNACGKWYTDYEISGK